MNRRFSEIIHRLLVRTYPGEFRDEYGDEIHRDFRTRVMRQRKGGLVMLWLRTLIDWLRSMPREQWSATRQNVSWAMRSFRKTPVFTAVAVLSLTLGIGINTAFFSLVNALILRPLPVPHPEQLLCLQVRSAAPEPNRVFTYPMFQAIESHNRVFSKVAAWGNTQLIMGPKHDRHTVRGLTATGSYFNMLGVAARRGRVFTEQDDADASLVAVVSDSFWKSELGGDPSIVGKTLRLNDQPFTIIGVMPPDFFGTDAGSSPGITIPIHAHDRLHPDYHVFTYRRTWWLSVMGRMKDGVLERSARAQLLAISPAVMADAFQGLKEAAALQADKLETEPGATGGSNWREQYGRPLLILMGISGILLLVACINMAGLLLSRGEMRQKEMAIRLALGAGRRRLVSQLLTESVLLSAFGAALGVIFAYWTTGLIVRFLSADGSFVLDLHPDVRVLAFMAAMALLTGILFGVLPALRASRVRPNDALKQGPIGTFRRLRGWGAARTLLTAQMALSAVLLAGALLFTGTLRNLASQNMGFDKENVVLIETDASKSGLIAAELKPPAPAPSTAIFDYYRQILDRTRSLPFVHSVGLLAVLPVEGAYMTYDVSSKWRPGLSEAQRTVHVNRAGPGAFRAMGTAVRRGREFLDSDQQSNETAMVINESAARMYFPGEDPVGKELLLETPKPYRIVGVVEDAKYESLRDPAPRIAYFNLMQENPQFVDYANFVIRASADKGPVVNAFRSIVKSAGPDVNIARVLTMSEEIDQALVRERLLAMLSTLFGLLAILLVSIGLYGFMSFAVVRRTGEIGIRIALGALPRLVRSMVLREAVVLAAVGLAIGLPLALFASQIVGSMLYGVKGADPLLLGACAALMLLVACVAVTIPARRASRVDPMVALRNE